ncbi:MAG: peroxiredoxin-like family protein [Nitrospirota bacterium]
MRRRIGNIIGKRSLATVGSGLVEIPDPRDLVHLQFRRFAGCPFCSLHLRSFTARREEIDAAGIQEVVVFYSERSALAPYVGDTPFAIVPDPRKRLYVEFGVEPSWRAVLDPRVWWPAARGVLANGLRLPRVWRGETPLGLPADFLIGPDGRLLACKYGAHAYDQWSVDELLALARSVVQP